MKYFGKKSLSSVASGILHVSWYVVLVGSIIFTFVLAIMLMHISFGDPVTSVISKGSFNFCGFMDYQDKEYGNINGWPLFAKIIIFPYFVVFVVLMLQIIKKTHNLFINFKNDIVFDKNNAIIISKISKLNIALSIITFNLSLLLVSVLLFMLCEILKNGSVLQEDHDLTI